MEFTKTDRPLVPTSWCPSTIELRVGARERLLVISDLFLTECPEGTPAQPFASLATHLKDALSEWHGQAHLVVAGNMFDLISGRQSSKASGETTPATADEIFKVNKEFCDFLRNFKKEYGGDLIVIPGARDARLAWDAQLADNLHNLTGCRFALEVLIDLSTASGEERILIQSGRAFDDRSRSVDPYAAYDTPWLYHQLSELMPRLSRASSSTLWGMGRLESPEELPKLAASQIIFKKVIRYGSLSLVPIIVALLLRIPLALSLPGVQRLKHLKLLGRIKFELIGVTTLIDLIILLSVALVITRRVYSSLGRTNNSPAPEQDPNQKARLASERLQLEGFTGMICGHSLSPELSRIGDGFFANCGGSLIILRRTKARLALPDYFMQDSMVTWIEIDSGPSYHVRLNGFSPEFDRPISDRIFAKPEQRLPRAPQTLGSFPDGVDFPVTDQRGITRLRRPRRIAHAATLALGLIDLTSALTPPFRDRLRAILEFLPSTVPTFADALTALIGVALLGLSYGIAKGQRRAWIVATAAVSLGVISNLAKGGDFEESAALAVLLFYLVRHRDSFTLKGGYERIPTRVARAIALLALTFVIGFFSILIFSDIGHGIRTISATDAALASITRMVGTPFVVLPHLFNRFISPGLFAATIAIFTYLAASLFLPYVSELSLPSRRKDEALSHSEEEIVKLYSRGTLDYFALRDDKEHYVSHDSLIAYGIYGHTLLVSPDPIGPEAGSKAALVELVNSLRSKGNSIAILGADERWLDTYRSLGLHPYYIGDEAIVEIGSLSLDGKRHKGLRQAVNRVRKYGYTAEFYSPVTIPDELRSQAIEIMTRSRRGDAERGFSMTLGRVMQQKDAELLETICRGPDGTVVGFCQWVPAPGIDGFSLDLMRRDTGEHPNGLIDFMIVETIEHLKVLGKTRLSLNFATMRGVLAGERGDGVSQRLERMLLRRLGDSMQIESLWKFNAKFDPHWTPRYLVYDKVEDLPSVLVAVAKAESFWEIPILGRFLSTEQSEQKLPTKTENADA